MGTTTNFFKSKKPWSKLKDELLAWYLKPYVLKLLSSKRSLYIIDCFAGKGKFDDGSNGSPLIIADRISEVLDDEKAKNKEVYGRFIEKKYRSDLENNIKNYRNCIVWDGCFEDNIERIKEIAAENNLLIYIDPYGIKNLDFNIFKDFCTASKRSIEMLMNFNSFGFLREGCRLLNYRIDQELVDEEDEDYENDVNTIDNMDRVANGDYWQHLIEKYYNNEIDMIRTEREFSAMYLSRFNSIFKYVLDIPIKTKTKNMPKYRIVFGTNSPDGYILMADNMARKWRNFIEQERQGQLCMFHELASNDIIIQEKIEELIIKHVKKERRIELKSLIVKLIGDCGIAFTESDYKNRIKELRKRGAIKIDHILPTTQSGQVATSMDYSKYKIFINCN
jgi:three-Cys-motif partner protein